MGNSLELKNFIENRVPLSLQIFDRNGKKIANRFDKNHRIYVQYDSLPSYLINAILASEDTDFFEHSGINIMAMFRALSANLQEAKYVQGASTLTQQLIKNSLLSSEKSLNRKYKEILFALNLENKLTKEEIFERYVNTMFLGHGYYGFRTASKGYYQKELDELTLKEIAMLVLFLKAPSDYSAEKYFKKALQRANLIIERMYTLGFIHKDTYTKAINEEPKLLRNQTLTQNKAPFIVDEVIRQIASDYPDYKTGGYKVFTTIDLDYQKVAEEAISIGYKRAIAFAKHKNIDSLNAAMISLESESGKILALVGGINYNNDQFNVATQSKKRSIGSTVKPFVYQIAIENGYLPSLRLNARISQDKSWNPRNYNRESKKYVSLEEALIHSKNIATANLAYKQGYNTVYNRLKEYGFENPHKKPIVLGSINLSLLELSKLYTIFSNKGQRVEPYLISSIEKFNGEIDDFDRKKERLVRIKQNTVMTGMLRRVITHGTGKKASVKGIELAGKTGTTNNCVDALFCGYSPSIQTIVWLGNDNNKPMANKSTGGRIAAPIFGDYYRKLIKLNPNIKRKFDES